MVASRGLGEQLIAGYLGSPACKAHNASHDFHMASIYSAQFIVADLLSMILFVIPCSRQHSVFQGLQNCNGQLVMVTAYAAWE